MSESRFSVDDILKEVEQMRSAGTKKAQVETKVPKTPENNEKTSTTKAEDFEDFLKSVKDNTYTPAQKVEKKAENKDSAEKLKTFLDKTEDTGYTPGESEKAKVNVDTLYSGDTMIENPLKRPRRTYNPNVLTPDEINANTIVMPAIKEIPKKTESSSKKPETPEFKIDDIDGPDGNITPENEEIEDYRNVRDADDIRLEFKSRLFSVSVKMIITAICTLLSGAIPVLSYFGIELPFVSEGFGLLCAQAVLAGIVLITNFTSLVLGFFSTFIFRAQIDSPCAIAMATAIAQLVYLAFIPSHATAQTVYTCAALLCVFVNLCGKRLLLSRTLKNFKLVSNADAKQSCFVMDESTADKIAPEQIGNPIVCGQKSVINLQNYVHNSMCEDPSDTVSRVLSPIALAVIAIAGIIAWVSTSNMTFVFQTIAAFGAVAVPVATLIATNLPLSTLCRSLREKGALVSGYNSVKEFANVNSAVIEDEDLFPQGSIDLVSVKALGTKQLDEVLMLTAAVAISAKGAFADVFDRMIEGRRESLPCVYALSCCDGMGIEGEVEGYKVKFGNRKYMMNEHSVNLPDEEFDNKMSRAGNFPYYIAVDGELCALCLMRHNNIVDTDNLNYIRRMTRAGVDIYVSTCDPYITPELISELFSVPQKKVYILNNAQRLAYERACRPSENGESLIAHNNSAAAFSCMLAGVKRVKTRIIYGVLLQILLTVLGVCALSYFMIMASAFSGSLYVLIFEAVASLSVAIIPRFFSLQ